MTMQAPDFERDVDALVTKNPRYPREAYIFLREALDRTQKAASKSNKRRSSHVTAAELLDGIREHALEEFGPMAITVLEDWGLKRCEDFGALVFNLVEAGLLSKTEKDNPDDFKGGFDFDDAFRKPFLPPSKLPPDRGGAVRKASSGGA